MVEVEVGVGVVVEVGVEVVVVVEVGVEVVVVVVVEVVVGVVVEVGVEVVVVVEVGVEVVVVVVVVVEVVMKKQPLKLYCARKYIFAKNLADAIKKEKSIPVDEIWIDDDWRKANQDEQQKAVGFHR